MQRLASSRHLWDSQDAHIHKQTRTRIKNGTATTKETNTATPENRIIHASSVSQHCTLDASTAHCAAADKRLQYSSRAGAK